MREHERYRPRGFTGLVSKLLIAGAGMAVKQATRRDFFRVDHAVEIERPIERVFAFATASETLPLWASEIVEVVQMTPGPLGVGARLRCRAKLLVVTQTQTVQLTTFDPPNSLSVRLTWGLTPVELFLTLTKRSEATLIAVTVSAEVLRIARAASEAITRRNVEASLNTLKHLLEHPAEGDAHTEESPQTTQTTSSMTTTGELDDR